LSHSLSYGHPHKSFRHTFMVTVWFGVGQFLSGAMGQLYPGGDIIEQININIKYSSILKSCFKYITNVFPGNYHGNI